RELRRTIEEHLATRSRSSRPPQSGEYVPEIPRDARLPQFDARQSLENGFIPPSEALEAEAPRSRKSLFLVAAGVVGAIALVAAGLLLANGHSGRQPAGAAVSTEPVKLAGPPAQTARQSPTESIWVSLSATPDDAEIRLDGRRVSNPYRAAHGRDAISHYISVSLNGYETVEREVSFAHELELRFALDATSRGGTLRQTGPSATVRQVASNEPVANLAPATPPASASLPAGESSAGATKPGDDLRGVDVPTIKVRDIDETDPYKR
ncbi:MAG TPA: hypothetical protein VKP30_09830, partial [Polyangiaceae bacterium]|nr:hypothetical protein [Polyangiaceae bacterium]